LRGTAPTPRRPAPRAPPRPPPPTRAGTQLQWPRGGPQAIADALVAALRRRGGKLLLRAPVARVLTRADLRSGPGPGGSAAAAGGGGGGGGRAAAAGVELEGGRRVAAARAVISNASLWDTARLAPAESLLPEFREQVGERAGGRVGGSVGRCVQLRGLGHTQPQKAARQAARLLLRSRHHRLANLPRSPPPKSSPPSSPATALRTFTPSCPRPPASTPRPSQCTRTSWPPPSWATPGGRR
jgi:hypothetical protein